MDRSIILHARCKWDGNQDLPVFVKVIVLVAVALLEVELFFTEGISTHLASCLIIPTCEKRLLNLLALDNKEVLYAHTFLGDRKMYMCMRSQSERLN